MRTIVKDYCRVLRQCVTYLCAMGKPMVRIDEKVAALVAKSAKENFRSVPQEVNRLLRWALNVSLAKSLRKKGGK